MLFYTFIKPINKEMKFIVFLFAGFDRCDYAFSPVFSEKSAFERSLEFATKFDSENNAGIVIAVNPATEEKVKSLISIYSNNDVQINTVCASKWNVHTLLKQMAFSCASCSADTVVYAMADKPFLDAELSSQVLEYHQKYLAEYTFAEGWPLGFAPEVIALGTLNIMATLAENERKAQGEASVGANSIFSIMEGDLNSFEIESVIAPKDFRMLRFDFSCSSLEKLTSCSRLYSLAKDSNIEQKALPLTQLAYKTASVQRTVPAFYNIQIAEGCSSLVPYSPYKKLVLKDSKYMSLENFKSIIEQAAKLSDTAVVSLSAFGEVLSVPNIVSYIQTVLDYAGLSVLIETDGLLLTKEIAQSIAQVAANALPRTNGYVPVIWIVDVDAFSQDMYDKIHTDCVINENKTAFSKAIESVETLSSLFAGSTYIQFTRMTENENELEQFYRFWHEKSLSGNINVIIQKYDSFCGLLPDKKPADLSPLERCPCWHLKRDIFILLDGNVPICKDCYAEPSVGNVFMEGVESVWSKGTALLEEHLKNVYNEKCGGCDEYYTYNF